MPRQSISLTPPNDAWLKAQVESQEYASKSDVVNDLIRKARAKQEKVEEIRLKLIQAEQSGFITPNRQEILAEFKKVLDSNG
ncbi:CopG family transcriptional regulator [Scytonema hofmannii PCC 7110]|uniref:CopG family transcriptional regulator n=1 Tax=Scytonema hofmannii PCC 7110 TaxID=128403 RepID=A0A139X277_9CYAN|nr:type II toxin-antitoxin system ParD family antitoxin [Scytonema hofmannii]KYC38807.1 CopG family transcriptional regulator [Scytonema hofmannii PCC 7110]